MDDGYRLIAADAAGVRPSLTPAIYARHIAMRQKEGGYWLCNDNRPPQSYSPITSTAVALRALQLYSHPSMRTDTRQRVERARARLSSQRAATTEERAYQLLGLLWSEAPVADRKRLADALMRQQGDDGGWNEINGRASDAYSTGQVLVALYDSAGVPASDPHWRRGIDFLLKTQQPDGSWHVASRLMPPVQVSPPYFETGYPYGHDQFISLMGATWAARAIARAAGSSKPVTPAILAAASPATEPWMEMALFGSAADLSKLLDSGWKANSATAGGSTALMLAMPDVEKARLLIEHGADVNARAKTRYNALLVAAQYPTAAPAVELLLAHGARNKLPKGEGAPLFNATAMAAATLGGFPSLLPLFAKQNDRPDDKFVALGMFSTIPVAFPVNMGDPATVKTDLDTGLPVDTSDDDQLTLLDMAVIANRVDVARLLIERGADVNHVDKFGMTPLQHAASVDFGSSEMVDLLKKSGAKLDARTKEGLTSLELARKYGHQNLLKSLAGM